MHERPTTDDARSFEAAQEEQPTTIATDRHEDQVAVEQRAPIAEPIRTYAEESRTATDQPRRESRHYFHAPNYWPLLQDALTQEEYTASSRIVTVGSVTVSVENLLDAIHGREFFPILTAAEIMLVSENEGADRHDQWGPAYLRRSGKIQDIKKALEKSREQKRAHIQALISESTVDYESVNLPSREAIMLALSENEMRHVGSVTEFLGTVVQLTQTDVGHAEYAQQEMMTTDTLASRNIDHRSSRSIRETWSNREIVEFAERLDLEPEKLLEMPEALLERAINRHKLDESDITQIRHASANANKLNELPVVVESAVLTAGFITTAGTFGATLVATSVFGASVTGPVVNALLATSLSGIGIGIGAGLLGRFANEPLTRIARKFVSARRIKQYEKQLSSEFSQLQQKVQELQSSGLGNLQLRLLEEMIKMRTGTHTEKTAADVELLRKWIVFFQDNPQEAQRLEEVLQLGHHTDFHGKGVWQVIQDYRSKADADNELN